MITDGFGHGSFKTKQLRNLLVKLLVYNMFVKRSGFRRVMMMAFDAKVNIDFLFVDRLASCVVV